MVKKKATSVKSKNAVATKFSEAEFYFDNCIICRGMKEAEHRGKSLNTDDLKRLFKKAGKNKKSK